MNNVATIYVTIIQMWEELQFSYFSEKMALLWNYFITDVFYQPTLICKHKIRNWCFFRYPQLDFNCLLL
jgi:hypothetical protein